MGRRRRADQGDGEELFDFNLELVVAPRSGAFVGVAVTNTEHAAAVIDAVKDAVTTTGEAPLSALLPGVSREVARQFVIAVVTTWARTLNHRPRTDRDGKSRVQLHLDHGPTTEEIAAATAALAERLRR